MTVTWKMYSDYVVTVCVWLGCLYVYFTSSSYLSSLTCYLDRDIREGFLNLEKVVGIFFYS